MIDFIFPHLQHNPPSPLCSKTFHSRKSATHIQDTHLFYKPSRVSTSDFHFRPSLRQTAALGRHLLSPRSCHTLLTPRCRHHCGHHIPPMLPPFTVLPPTGHRTADHSSPRCHHPTSRNQCNKTEIVNKISQKDQKEKREVAFPTAPTSPNLHTYPITPHFHL